VRISNPTEMKSISFISHIFCYVADSCSSGITELVSPLDNKLEGYSDFTSRLNTVQTNQLLPSTTNTPTITQSVETGYWLVKRAFCTQQRRNRLQGLTQPPIQGIPRPINSGIKWPGREVDQSHLLLR
jgi:hypothetical protein